MGQHMEGRDIKELTLLKLEEASCVEDAEGGVDPALWRCDFLNRLQLQMPEGRLVSLPDLVGKLVHLDTLILSCNSLRGLPDAIESLQLLRVLEVDRNSLETIPAALGKLSKLEVLNLAGNILTSLKPIDEGSLPNLLTLSVDSNRLESLDLPFSSMSRIEVISSSNNAITSLDEAFGLVQGSLVSLSLSSNKIESLSGIRDLKEKKLKFLTVDENPIADKKVLKILNGNRPEQVIKELLKYLQKQGPSEG